MTGKIHSETFLQHDVQAGRIPTRKKSSECKERTQVLNAVVAEALQPAGDAALAIVFGFCSDGKKPIWVGFKGCPTSTRPRDRCTHLFIRSSSEGL